MLRVRVAGTGWPGAPSLNTFYYDVATPDVAAANACLAHVHAFWTAQKGIFPSVTSWQVQDVVDVIDHNTGQITDSLTGTTLAAIVPTGATFSALPISSAALLSLKTATFINGRRLKGRAFLSPVASGMIAAGGVPSSSLIASVNAIGTALVAGTSLADKAVVWHRPKLGVGGQLAEITSATCSTQFAVLRSRRD